MAALARAAFALYMVSRDLRRPLNTFCMALEAVVMVNYLHLLPPVRDTVLMASGAVLPRQLVRAGRGRDCCRCIRCISPTVVAERAALRTAECLAVAVHAPLVVCSLKPWFA